MPSEASVAAMHHDSTVAQYLGFVCMCTLRKVAAILAALLSVTTVGAILSSLCCRYSVWGVGGSQGWSSFMLSKPSVLTSATCAAKSAACRAVIWREPLVSPAISSGPTMAACRASKTVARVDVRACVRALVWYVTHCKTDFCHVCCPVECMSDQEVCEALDKLRSDKDCRAFARCALSHRFEETACNAQQSVMNAACQNVSGSSLSSHTCSEQTSSEKRQAVAARPS